MTDYGELANGVDQMRETMAALVAGLIHDGFTDREARMIVAGVVAAQMKGESDD